MGKKRSPPNQFKTKGAGYSGARVLKFPWVIITYSGDTPKNWKLISVVVKRISRIAQLAIEIPAHVIEKGRCKDPFMHNMLPDINKEMFEYLLKRVAVLEHILVEDNKNVLEEDLELENIYESFIRAMKS